MKKRDKNRKQFICKRCHEELPRKNTRRSKVFGGRICQQCNKVMRALYK